jgi:hypothetical protein
MAKSSERTLTAGMARTRRGIIDDTVVTVRPSPEEIEARRAEAEAFLAQQRAMPRSSAPPRGTPRRRTSA